MLKAWTRVTRERGELEPGAHPAPRLNAGGDRGGQGQEVRDGAGRQMRPEAMIQGLRCQAGSSPALVHLVSPGELPGIPPQERMV